MAVVHKNLPDSQLHEPKGVAGASADQVYVTDGAGSGTFKPYDKEFSAFETADGGKVYVSDGAGSGILRDYDKEPKGIDTADSDQVYVSDGSGSGAWSDYYTPTSPAYAGMISQNDSSITLSAASDSTLKTNSDYVPLNNTGMWDSEAASNASISASSGQITLTEPGTYQISFCGSFFLGVKGRIGLIFGHNGDFYTKRTIVDVDTSGTPIATSTMIPNVSADTTIGVYVASEDEETLTINTAGLSAVRLSE